jgi:2-polyprenyl-3-methyl-5-hydroxy-6-metoxy-1,4-benzoquinol methylase
MKDLLSKRFSLESQNDLPYLSIKQVQYREMVRQKINNGFIFASNPCPCSNGGPVYDVVIAEIDRYGLPLSSVLCTRCGTVRIDPYLDETSLADFYSNYYQDMYGRSVKVDSYFKKQQQYGKKFLAISKDFLPLRANVLEFGCGAGGGLEAFRRKGHNVYGTEYSTKLIEYGKLQGLHNLFYGSVEDIKATFGNLKFDLIFSNHVFEHVDKPINYLRHCVALLKPEGRIICSVPDVYGSARYIFPNSDLRLMFHIAHIYNYSFSCLQMIASQLQLKVERIFPSECIITPTSVMPELWFEMRNAYSSLGPSSESKAGGEPPNPDYLEFFQRTEKKFLAGDDLLKVEVPMLYKIKTKLKHYLKWKK